MLSFSQSSVSLKARYDRDIHDINISSVSAV